MSHTYQSPKGILFTFNSDFSHVMKIRTLDGKEIEAYAEEIMDAVISLIIAHNYKGLGVMFDDARDWHKLEELKALTLRVNALERIIKDMQEKKEKEDDSRYMGFS